MTASAARRARTTQDSPASDDAIGVLIRTFNAAAAKGEKVDILMIGPLTNLALALRLDPAIVDGIGTLTIMGGTVYGRGNTTPAAEFNIYADPEAAHIVFTADIETVVVPWEPCMTHFMTGDAHRRAVRRHRGQPDAQTFRRRWPTMPARTCCRRGGRDRFRFVDPLAAAVVIDPVIVTKSVHASSSVALAPGITRGMTVVDPSGRLGTPMITFVEEVDIAKIDALYAVSAAYTPKKAVELQAESAHVCSQIHRQAATGLILAAGLSATAIPAPAWPPNTPRITRSRSRSSLHGNLGDKSFFDSAAAGLKKAEADLPVTVKIIEAGYDRSKWQPALRRRHRWRL